MMARPMYKNLRNAMYWGRKSWGVAGPVHRFKETMTYGLIQNTCAAGPAPGETLGAYTFYISQIPNIANYGNIYDEYRIAWVKLHFTALANSNQLAAVGTQAQVSYPFWTVIDYNDASSATPVADLKLYANAKAHDITKSFDVFFRPHILKMVYQSAIATSYQSENPGWIPIADGAVPHYGLKYGCSGVLLTAGTIDLFQVDVTYGLMFRSQK